MDNKTIYALSTVYGKSGVAIIRISGTNALEAVSQMTNIDTKTIKGRIIRKSDIPAAFIANNSNRSPKFPNVINDDIKMVMGSAIGTEDNAA